MINDMKVEELKKSYFCNDILLEYGWILPPLLTGGDFQLICNLCNLIEKNDSDSNVAVKKIDMVLSQAIFHPNYRTYAIDRAKKLPYVKRFSHYIEIGTLHYYKGDYFSCVLCLLPAIEGVLLEYYGWNIDEGERKPYINQLIKKIVESKPAVFSPQNYTFYVKSIIKLLENWIFKDTSAADFTTSYLNRHYALHGMGTKHFYKRSDCNRLFVFFDVFMEIIAEAENLYEFSIPGKLIESERVKYLFELIRNKDEIQVNVVTEKAFLSEHTNYHNEDRMIWCDYEIKEKNNIMMFLSGILNKE